MIYMTCCPRWSCSELAMLYPLLDAMIAEASTTDAASPASLEAKSLPTDGPMRNEASNPVDLASHAPSKRPRVPVAHNCKGTAF